MNLEAIYGKEVTAVETIISELYTRENDFGIACNDEAEKEHAFKLANASNFLAAEGTIDMRKADALVKCADAHQAYLKAQAVKEFTKEKLRDSQQVLSARQSLLSASVKSDLGYANDRRIT